MWYGLNAAVSIGPGFLHTAGFGTFMLPHPPVINWLLRQHLTSHDSDSLSFTHEFGHLQTLPLAALYTGAMLLIALFARRNLIEIIIILTSTHAAWEMMAEIFTIVSDAAHYKKCYRGVTVVPRAIFWTVTGSLAVAGWVVVLHYS